jgi:hypothetical protein
MSQDSWMTSEKNFQQIDRVRNEIESGADQVRLAVSLRKQLSVEQGSFVLSQAVLQIRARKKFTNAEQMLFTKVGLEQATSETISRFKATLIPPNLERFDVCCGIGGDSMGIGLEEKVTSVDRDELTCKIASHNLSVNGLSEFQVLQTGFDELQMPEGIFVHVDPDRRTKGRTVRGEHFSPTLDEIIHKLVSPATRNTVCIKLAPATRFEHELEFPHHKQWIGHQRECKQQLLWMGQGCEENADSVTVISNCGNAVSFQAPQRKFQHVVAPRMGDFIHEPHSAVLGADLVDEFAEAHDLGRLSYGSVYLTGQALEATPLAASFRVLDTCAMKAKAIKQCLESHDIGNVVWKSRGLESKTVSRLSKVKTKGTQQGVVILTRLNDKYLCYVCLREP